MATLSHTGVLDRLCRTNDELHVYSEDPVTGNPESFRFLQGDEIVTLRTVNRLIDMGFVKLLPVFEDGIQIDWTSVQLTDVGRKFGEAQCSPIIDVDDFILDHCILPDEVAGSRTWLFTFKKGNGESFERILGGTWEVVSKLAKQVAIANRCWTAVLNP